MKKLLFIPMLFFTCITLAQTKPDYAWITGSWIGDGFGGISEEVWSEPSPDGTILGLYRHTSKEGVSNFYEMFILDSTGLKLKHYNPDFSGWEEKDDFLTFEMVETSPNKIVLKGLTYEQLSETEMKISLKMKTKEGLKTEVFNMKRRD